MGKRKIMNEGNLENMVLPAANDVLGMAVKMLGAERIMVKCQDGKERLCRIRGKLRGACGSEKATSSWFPHGIFSQTRDETFSGGTGETSLTG